MEQVLTSRFVHGVEETLKKQEAKWEETVVRLEGRINRSREHQESMITSLKEEQVKFQKEMRTVMSGFHSTPPNLTKTLERSINHGGVPGCGKSGIIMGGEGSSNGAPFGVEGHGWAGCGGGPGGGGNMAGGANWRYKRLDLPLFDGTNPDGWILRAERYFNFYKLSEEEKVEATVVALEGQALIWFQWENRRRPIES